MGHSHSRTKASHRAVDRLLLLRNCFIITAHYKSPPRSGAVPRPARIYPNPSTCQIFWQRSLIEGRCSRSYKRRPFRWWCFIMRVRMCPDALPTPWTRSHCSAPLPVFRLGGTAVTADDAELRRAIPHPPAKALSSRGISVGH